MSSQLITIIESPDPAVRNRSIESVCAGLSAEALLAHCAELDGYRRRCENLYYRVRALFHLYAIHRFHLPTVLPPSAHGLVSFEGYSHLLQRRFEEAIDQFLADQAKGGPSEGVSSALAQAYRELAFQTLANQVRRSVRSVQGNQWMFRMGHPADQPLRLRPQLLQRGGDGRGPFPVLAEKTPVRMDLSHSAWSDIFFLGMDFPEGARVLNVSIDLAVRGRDTQPRPPVEAYLRVIDEPIIRLVSVDLGAFAEVRSIAEVFDFARDYLGLLKAALIASGVVPAGLEGSEQSLADLLAVMVGPGMGLELVSNVNNIPKGSRLAVSTTLLAGLISLLMRATGQAGSLTGALSESERRLVAARAILGEWLAGSGGGWQDSGGVWPGMKLITGALAGDTDPEHGISRGCLLPNHRIFTDSDASAETRRALQDSLVLVHGGMAQNVGPILEMVTEKYLLRSEAEWQARQEAMRVLDRIVAALREGDIPGIGAATTHNFMAPIQAIIPAASNLFTETVIARTRAHFGSDFWGFWMLGGMSGGGMGFIFAPSRKAEAQKFLQETMSTVKRQVQHALPFAMEPVVYDFAINEKGTFASLLGDGTSDGTSGCTSGGGGTSGGAGGMMPAGYYALMVPRWLKAEARDLRPLTRTELERFGAAVRNQSTMTGMVQTLFDRLVPQGVKEQTGAGDLTTLLNENGFDHEQHETVRTALRTGRIGLAQNRLPASTTIEDVRDGDVVDATRGVDSSCLAAGRKAIENGEIAVVALAAGAGSRWTQGAGVVKALHPFAKLAGKHRSFLEVHLAKARRGATMFHVEHPFVVTTSYLTHKPIEDYLCANHRYGHTGPLLLSPGRAIGLRMIPMERDLRFAWEETAHQVLDEQRQKVRDSLHAALINWAKTAGEGADYTDNLPSQCLHPVGHWFEVPNLLLNGTLERLLRDRPQLRYLMLHNIDTLGADADPGLLGLFILRGWALGFEVINRRIEDRGGGLARVDGRLRLVEGLAMPREELEFGLSYYNTLTTWIDIDQLLALFGLTRADLLERDAETGQGRPLLPSPLGEAGRGAPSATQGVRSPLPTSPQRGGEESRPTGTFSNALSGRAKTAAAVRRLAARMPTYVTLKEAKKRWGHGQEDVYPVAQFEKLWGDMTALPDASCGFMAVHRHRGQQLKDQAQLDGWLRDGSAKYVEGLCQWE